MKKVLLVFLVLFVLVFFIRDDVSNLFTGRVIEEVEKTSERMIPHDFGNIRVCFCPADNCEDILANEIRNSERIDCAFFELGLDNVIDALRDVDHRVIIDNRHKGKVNMSFLHYDHRQELMHNKFCIFDNSKIFTGSMNPTKYGAYRNNNNLVIIESKSLARNYEDEFNEMWRGEFGKGNEVYYPVVNFNDFLIENYFCPEDGCEEIVLELLKKARKRIYFMTFSFTSDVLGGEVIRNFHYGLDIKGVFEKTQAGSEYSEYRKMKDLGMNVKKDNNKGMMHHKVFIVDDSVVLGSYNPSKSGNERNDENILIIHDREVAEKFVEEFEKVWNL